MSTKGPKIRIGVLQETDQAEFRVQGAFRVEDGEGNLITTLPPVDTPWKVRAVDPSPAEVRYRLLVFRDKKEKPVSDQEKTFRKMGWVTKIVQMGHRFPELPAELSDNREFWLLLGDWGDPTPAQEALKSFPGDVEVIPDRIKIPVGKLRLFSDQNPTGWVVSNKIRILPDDRERGRVAVVNIRVGIEFHWEHLQTQSYRGIVEMGLSNSGKVQVINELPLEEYLYSVNSSEMTADSPPELLKAQTLAGRNTALATMGKHHPEADFDLCADDHCQCYQGSGREGERSIQAVQNTFGEVLVYRDEICDARYSKICGGAMEAYEKVWGGGPVPYMGFGIDAEDPSEVETYLPLEDDENARRFIDGRPSAYCAYPDVVLPGHLHRIGGYFRWQVSYSQAELQEILLPNLGRSIGPILDLVPVKRGASGRITVMEFIGEKEKVEIRDQLKIRKMLSPSHLYSSCFYVVKEMGKDGRPVKFILKGAGWGHGVGLCQVGAAAMALEGKSYREILSHYYKNTFMRKVY